jgi:hypothetical protein
MRHVVNRVLPVVGLILPIALGASAAPKPAAVPTPSAIPIPADGAAFFTSRVRPILEANCLTCHSGEKPQGGLRLTSREGLLKGGLSGPAVKLGDRSHGLLLAAVNYQGRRMPPRGKLAQREIDTLAQWVRIGLPWPSGEAGNLEPMGHAGPPPVTPETMKFWSFQPVRRPAVPKVRNVAWVRTPVDAFILKRLEDEGLAPNPPADRAALLRRATYDMLGLPPSPEEVRAFLADTSPGAWEKVVDRLLASPHYGERWGRHWLDLVHFAETNSYERDGPKPNAWRYRDYVIDSFNRDKPYDQFVLEQLAGDEIAPRTPERLIATGYYRLGIWDDEPVDHDQALYDDLDDVARTTGETFLGLTIGCARCHDHKLDPIPAKDYYRFLAFFAGVTRFGGSGRSVEQASLRALNPDEGRRYDAAVEAHRATVRANLQALAAIEQKVLADLTPVEKEDWRSEDVRTLILKKRVGTLLTQADLDRYATLRDEKRQLQTSQPPAMEAALCVTEIEKPREMHVLLRGNPRSPGDPVEPGFLSVLAPPQPQIAPAGETSGRRLALARWIAGKENPLTARVMANRVWQYHFGRGIVRSSNNFGFQGDKPTHPELLDWLASELAENGWRLKSLHRQILLSSTYRMSSRANAVATRKDPENNLFWRFDMRRLEAEELRDSILAANGSLNPTMAGPSIYPTIPAAVLAGQSVPGSGWGKSSPEEQARRSVYIYVKRSLIEPMIASFDGPDPDLPCPARFATTQPTQALGMLNSDFINQQAAVFARLLKQKAGDKPADQVTLALWRVLQRAPTPAEVARGVRLIESLQRNEKATSDAALTAFCLVALNLNEFVYVD